MKSKGAWTLFLLAATATVFCVPLAYQLQLRYQRETISHFGLLPSPLVRLLTLEFKGVTADYLLLKTISYIGYKLLEKERLDEKEWEQVIAMLDRITDLDPKFWDPYLLAAMTLPWDAGKLDEANRLLKKATRARPEDFRPWYLLGFNAFFFEKNAKKAAPYLRRAASLPGGPDFLKGLAARFSYYGGETDLGILYLKSILPQTTDKALRRHLTKRLAALTAMQTLERAVKAFQAKHGRLPKDLDELTRYGIIERIPSDPYGGRFYMLPNGRIYTTSKLVQKQKQASPQADE